MYSFSFLLQAHIVNNYFVTGIVLANFKIYFGEVSFLVSVSPLSCYPFIAIEIIISS